jgi:hypothetical protein
MMTFPRAPMTHVETVRPAVIAMEPSFLVAGPACEAGLDAASPVPCAGCGRVHRDRLVRFFEVRLTRPETSGGLATGLSQVRTALELDAPSPEYT